jgi:hypothetical protein
MAKKSSKTKTVAYMKNVFLNVPFDSAYRDGEFLIILFTVFDCGFLPRCALEQKDSGKFRLEKIYEIIEKCGLGIHDISFTGIDPNTKCARFNMPFELGIFMALQRYGTPKQKKKRISVLDTKKYGHRKSLSDISGQDIDIYLKKSPKSLIAAVRKFLSHHTAEVIPGEDEILKRYKHYVGTVRAEFCKKKKLNPKKVDYVDEVAILHHYIRHFSPVVP